MTTAFSSTAKLRQKGMTLVELIVTVAILAILAAGAVPIAQFQVKRAKERMLRYDLALIRSAIDKYKDAADRGAFMIEIDTQGYPRDLDVLVNGIDIRGKKVKFLGHIPVDPMTGKADWVLRSMQDDPQSDSWDGKHVFDIRSKSGGTGMNGVRYAEW